MSPAAAVGAQVGVAVAAFASTNLDNLALLVALCADRRLRPRNIAFGQGLGMGVLVLASLAGAAGAFAAPPRWAGWLGLVPLALGVRGLVTLGAPSNRAGPRLEAAGERDRAQVIATAALTLAAGGDNLGVYIPLFAAGLSEIPIYVAVFAVMTPAWFRLAQWLADRPWKLVRIGVLGRVVQPVVLTGLGLRMLAGALS